MGDGAACQLKAPVMTVAFERVAHFASFFFFFLLD